MPDINDLFNKTKNKFKKSEYRPWNYMDEIEKEDNQKKINENKNTLEELEEKSLQSDVVTNEKTEENKKKFSRVTLLENKTLEKIDFFPKENESILDKVFRLTGYQKILFFFISDRCISRGLLSTSAITSDTLTEVIPTSQMMIKTTIQRLVLKNLIIREKGKQGRGGFYCFSITESVRNATLEYKTLINLDQSIDIKRESYGYQSGINAGNSIPDSQIKGQTGSLLPEDWGLINYDPLVNIGFTKDHLIQLYRHALKNNVLDSEMVQRSINHFAFDLEHNNKASKINRTTPIGYLMKVFKDHGPYAAPDNYEAPQDKAMRIYLAQRKELTDKRDAQENELKKLAYIEWERVLTEDEKLAIVPEDQRKISGPGSLSIKNSYLRPYFDENIWPEERKKLGSVARSYPIE